MSTPTGAEDLNALLSKGGARIVNVKFFIGDGPIRDGELKSAVTSALSQKSAGTAVVSKTFNDDAVKLDVRALVASLQV